MDIQPIRLSALGRDVNVGNLYDYYTDNISQSNFDLNICNYFRDKFFAFCLRNRQSPSAKRMHPQ